MFTLFTFFTKQGFTTYCFPDSENYNFIIEEIENIMSCQQVDYGKTPQSSSEIRTALAVCAILTNDIPVLEQLGKEIDFPLPTDSEIKLKAFYQKLMGDFLFEKELLNELSLNPDYFMELEFDACILRKDYAGDKVSAYAAVL